jgi:hypothetical protein
MWGKGNTQSWEEELISKGKRIKIKEVTCFKRSKVERRKLPQTEH